MNRYISTILIMSIMALLVGGAVGQDATAGKTIFDSKCSGCHTAGPGPSLNMMSKIPTTTITTTVRSGISPAMPAFDSTNISNSDLDNLAMYITSQNASSSNVTNISATPYGTSTGSNISATPYGTGTGSNVTETPYNETNETNATTTSVAGTTVPETTTVEATIPINTPITTTAETAISTPAPVATTSAPGFDILLGIISILSVLLIYRLKQK